MPSTQYCFDRRKARAIALPIPFGRDVPVTMATWIDCSMFVCFYSMTTTTMLFPHPNKHQCIENDTISIISQHSIDFTMDM